VLELNMNKKKDIYLCSICNIQSGTCSEDCKFCTQSVKYKANIQRYKKKDIKDIINEAKIAKQNQAIGYCLVTAGAGLDDKQVEFVCEVASAVKKAVSNINLIGCNGIASKDQLKELKKAGISNYNHNLETSQEYYKQICTTHSWEDRYKTCQNVKDVGLGLLTGGIFGMGETYDDRISMLNSIKQLNPKSVPLNFFHPNEALPLTQNTLNIDKALDLVKLSKEILGDSIRVMVAGGREFVFKHRQYEIFKYGADAIVVGNYLTTKGKNSTEDIKQINDLGYTIAQYKSI
jgi:biotin synthase